MAGPSVDNRTVSSFPAAKRRKCDSQKLQKLPPAKFEDLPTRGIKDIL